ncbi:MAG: hypothetical protein V5A34_08925 [Halapricum sp.]
MRGQAHTLEAVVAALLLLTSLVFALQLTAVTPLSASTSSQHIENQQRAVGSGVLAGAAETGALKEAVLYWDNSSASFHNSNANGEYTDPPENRLGRMLERSFDRRGIAYNVYFRFSNGTGSERTTYIYSGAPSDNAVTATYFVTLTDDDYLYNADGSRTNIQLRRSSYFMPNQDSNVYNTVRVEVVAWRI